MKSFLFKTASFLALSFLLIALIFFLFVRSSKKISKEYTFSNEHKVLFIGDSHIQNAIIDSLCPGFLNMGKNSETYYYSYHKLKAILATENKIERVLLSFDYHNLSNYSDAFFLGEKSPVISSEYFHLLPKKYQIQLLVSHWDKLPTFTRQIIKESTRIADRSNRPFPGKFRNDFFRTQAEDSSIQKRIQTQFYSKKGLNDFSQFNLNYLDSIRLLCQKKEIYFNLIQAPVYSDYLDLIPEEYIEKYRSTTYKFSKETLVVPFDSTTKSYFLPDGDHLSYEGAEVFTEQVLNLDVFNCPKNISTNKNLQ